MDLKRKTRGWTELYNEELTIFTSRQILLRSSIKKDRRRALSRFGRHRKCLQDFHQENRNGRKMLEDRGMDGKIILKLTNGI
jgi:hypothetical protein